MSKEFWATLTEGGYIDLEIANDWEGRTENGYDIDVVLTLDDARKVIDVLTQAIQELEKRQSKP